MKFLVLKQNEQITNIYKKFFCKKNYDVDFAKSESECIKKFYDNQVLDNESKFDFVILEDSCRLLDGNSLEDKIRDLNPDQKIFLLSSYMNLDKSELSKETQEIIEKPFAMITLLGYIEIVWSKDMIIAK